MQFTVSKSRRPKSRRHRHADRRHLATCGRRIMAPGTIRFNL